MRREPVEIYYRSSDDGPQIVPISEAPKPQFRPKHLGSVHDVFVRPFIVTLVRTLFR